MKVFFVSIFALQSLAGGFLDEDLENLINILMNGVFNLKLMMML